VKHAALALVALAAGVALAHRAANANATADDGDGTTALDWIDPFGAVDRRIDQYQTDQAMQDKNTPAFLALIDYSEGTSRGGRDPYRTCYGYAHTIADLSDHPAVTGEWKGESIANLGPQYAGMVSTAAGRYQIKKSTWLECKRALGLPDFGPESQDRAAVYLIKRRGALDDVQAGRVADAVAKCRQEWASLPGAGYGQPERQLASLESAYVAAGGVLA